MRLSSITIGKRSAHAGNAKERATNWWEELNRQNGERQIVVSARQTKQFCSKLRADSTKAKMRIQPQKAQHKAPKQTPGGFMYKRDTDDNRVSISLARACQQHCEKIRDFKC
jgi:hypothetical protein